MTFANRFIRTAMIVLVGAIPLVTSHVVSADAAPMRIDDVRFAAPNNTVDIEIVGSNLDNGPTLSVTMDGTALKVASESGTLIAAEIPANTPDGRHLISVSTGPDAKQNAEAIFTIGDLGPGGSGDPIGMSVTCVDWFLSGGHEDHIHVEAFIEDELGNPVVGATVTFEASYDQHDGAGPFVYQTNTSTTLDDAGKNKGAGCAEPTEDSGVTFWFCCTGAGKWNGEIPGKRACPAGFYHAEVLSVAPPPGTNLVWDGVTPPNGREFSPDHL